MSTAATNVSPTTPASRGAGLTAVQVVFRRIVVSKISDPGSNAEVAFTLTVNGQTAPFVHNDLRTGITAINRTIVTAVDPEAMLRIAVRGIEKDTTSGDDILPAFTRTFTAEQRFGEGSHRVEASNSHMSYAMEFQIRRLIGLSTTLTGTATLTTSNSRARGPFTVPLTAGLFFDDSRTIVSVTSFPPITVKTGDGPVIVSRTGGANGSFTKSTGAMTLPVELHFDLPDDTPIPIGDSDLPISLGTGSVGGLNGARLDRTTGRIRLVGAGTFDEGFLDNEQATLVVDGELADLP